MSQPVRDIVYLAVSRPAQQKGSVGKPVNDPAGTITMTYWPGVWNL